MKKHVCFVLISGVAVAGMAAAAQKTVEQQEASLPQEQMSALVKTDLDTCDAKMPVVPHGSVRDFPAKRVEKTLHGIWRGRVWGDYPKELIAEDGFLNVDYYWIIDTERNEALILEQLSSTRAASKAPGGAAVWSFLTCGREGYVPRHPRQVHEFQKISNSLRDVRRMLESSTGLDMQRAEGDDQDLSLAEAWNQLVDTKYFDTKRYGAYAGGFFRGLQINETTNAAGAPMLSLSYQAEYRGAGQTAATFERGEPILGTETAGFIGVSTPSGDYLVSSLGNGSEWLKTDTTAATINMTIDKVVIGPLAE